MELIRKHDSVLAVATKTDRDSYGGGYGHVARDLRLLVRG
jgi:hypothetical protein